MGSDFGEVSSFAADLRHSSAKVRAKAQDSAPETTTPRTAL